MKALLHGVVLADSDQTLELDGYAYFPRAAVRMELLAPSEKTTADLACPHGVQFYDVVLGGQRHERTAWSYLAPKPALAAVKDRVGFWEDVEVA